MDVFTGLRPSRLLTKPKPLRKFKSLESGDEALIKDLSNVTALHEALYQRQKPVAESNGMRRTRAQKIHDASTHFMAPNIAIGILG